MSIQKQMYPRFYKQHGLRFLNQIRDPKLHAYDNLVLPLESIIHWVDYEGKYEVGPVQEEPLLKRSASKLFSESVSKYPDASVKGGWIIAKNNVKGYVTNYNSQNPNIKRMTKSVGDYNSREVLPLYTYGLVHLSYRYKNYVDAEVNRWLNYHYTIFQTALKTARISERQQFLEFEGPRSFPTFQSIKKGEMGIDKSNIRYLPSKDHWLIICLWNLIANNGNDFIFKGYELKDFERINILFRYGSEYLLINLGLLLGFSRGEKPAITPAKLQRRFLKMLIKLNTILEDTSDTTAELSEDIDAFGDEEDDTDDEPEEELEDDPEEVSIADGTNLNNPFKTGIIREPKAPQEKAEFKKADDIVLDDDDGALENDEDNEEEFLNILNSVTDSQDEEVGGYKAYVSKPVTPVSVVEEDAGKLVKAGVMSVGSFERLKNLAASSMNLKDPFGDAATIGEAAATSLEDVSIPDKVKLPIKTNDLIDESMQYSSLAKFHEQYIDEVFNKDILNAVMSIQKGGVIVKDYAIEKVETINEKYNVHKVQIETLKGHVSTLTFKLPVVESDGTFKSSGTRRVMRKQRGDVPIRKVDYNSAALTSYYNKMFVNRTERKQFNYEVFLQEHVVSSSIEGNHGIKEVKYDDVFDNTVKLPRVYTVLARKFNSFICNNDTLYFNINNLESNFKNRLRSKNMIPLAVNNKTKETSLYLNARAPHFLHNAQGESLDTTLDQYLGLHLNVIPNEYAEVNLYGKKIPLVLLLGHHLGFGNLLKTLKLKPRRETRGKRLTLAANEYAIKFNDEVLIFKRNENELATLIVNGLLRFKNTLNTKSVYDLDNKSVYSDLFEEIKAPIKLLKESKDMFNLWVDPITEKILIGMQEPTDLTLLFIRAVELLLVDKHPEPTDITYMRDKGYERMSGILYGELVKAVREYNSRSLYSNNKLTINPEAVWYGIITDQTVTLVEDSNPLHSMKEKEIIIYSGAGGRSGTTMTAVSRKYHKSNIGVTSEATVDSGDAGTIIYNSADPNYTSVYGLSKRIDNPEDATGAKIFSPSALLAVGAENDDTKRTNFVSVQNSQTTFSTGSTPMPMRTGMEKFVVARAGNMFSKTAKRPGKVIDVTPTSLVVEYDNGKKEGFNLGLKFGRWGGDNIPHTLKPNVKKGDTFDTGKCLYFNDHYFTKDNTDNENVILKNHVLARVAFVENYEVYEDSCALDKKFSDKLTTKTTHIRNIRVTSENTIKQLVKVGDKVNSDSILCTIHSSQLNDGFFSADTLSSLESLASLNPQAKYSGVIDRIDVIYTADPENVTEELADIIQEADARLFREAKRVGGGIKDGRVDVGFKVDGVNMTSDEVVVQIYITETIDMSIADKIVVANQLKSTVGRYWNEPQLTEGGDVIDVFFSAKSVDNRVVLSPEKIGTTNTLLVELTKRFIESYHK